MLVIAAGNTLWLCNVDCTCGHIVIGELQAHYDSADSVRTIWLQAHIVLYFVVFFLYELWCFVNAKV